MHRIVDLVEHQVIAAVRTHEALNEAVGSRADTIFLLFGDIFNIKQLVDKVRKAEKHVFVHLDFLEGLAADKSGVLYTAREIRPTGIISTRNHLINMAKDAGLIAIQRSFMVDSTAIKSGIKAIHSSGADAVEIMPGIMPKVIHELTAMTELPIIAGGLIRTENEVLNALEAGALAVSVGSPALWNMDL